MAIKFKYQAKEEIPTEHQAMHAEHEGGWVLNVEGVADPSRRFFPLHRLQETIALNGKPRASPPSLRTMPAAIFLLYPLHPAPIKAP
jgi:hypothetical protein